MVTLISFQRFFQHQKAWQSIDDCHTMWRLTPRPCPRRQIVAIDRGVRPVWDWASGRAHQHCSHPLIPPAPCWWSPLVPALISALSLDQPWSTGKDTGPTTTHLLPVAPVTPTRISVGVSHGQLAPGLPRVNTRAGSITPRPAWHR